MSCLPRFRPATAGRRIPRLEYLECRHLLSAATFPPGITAVQLESAPGGSGAGVSFDQADVDTITNDVFVPVRDPD